MKNLKLKSFLFGFWAIIVLSVLIISCNKEGTEPDEIESKKNNKEIIITPEIKASATYAKPPKGFENKTDEEMQNFINQLTEEQSKNLEENYRVSDYLESIGLLEKVESLLNDGELLTDLNLYNVIPHRLQELSKHIPVHDKRIPACENPEYIESRFCSKGCYPYQIEKRWFIEYCEDNPSPYRFVWFCNINC